MFANFGGERAKGFHPIEPLVGPAGFRTTPNFPSLPWQGAFVLSKKCRNPEAAIKYADVLYTKEATLWGRAGGAKDNFYRDAKEGEKDFYGKPAVWAPLKAWNDTEPQNHSWISLGVWDYTELRASQAVKPGMDYWGKEGLEYMLFKETVDKYKPVTLEYSIPPRSYTLEEQEQVAMLETEYKKFFDASQYNFITGKLSLDADWDKYLADLKSSGLTKLKALYQKAYDRQYNKK
jgi:putative aldouronate transport system substrate-binding protein